MQKKIGTKEKIGIKGKITVRTYTAGTLEAVMRFQAAAKKYKGYGMLAEAEKFLQYAKNALERGYLRSPVVQENMVMDSPNYGIDLIVQRLIGVNTYSLNIKYGEVGTGTTPVTSGDTALTTPTNRAQVSLAEDYGANEAIIQFYFPDAVLANGTYTEFGTFVDGSITIGSGQLFNHGLFSSPYTKISGEDTTVEVDFSIS